MSFEIESALRHQYRQMARMGFTVYHNGQEYPPLSEDDYIAAADCGRRVDLCRERDGRIIFWDGVFIRP